MRSLSRWAGIAALAAGAMLGATLTTTAVSAAPAVPLQAADTEAPSVPQGQVLVRGARSVTMRWNAATDNVAVAGYRLFRNGVAVGTTTAVRYTFANLRCGTTSTFALQAFDAAGNSSNRAQATGRAATLPCAAPKPKPKPKPIATKPPPKAPSGSTLAHLWVDPSGGACVRRATPGRWLDGSACSWSQAYARARSGDLVLVRGGDYGNVTVGADRPGVRGVTFRTASGERAVVRDFENGHVAGRAGASNVSFVGPATARTFRSDGASNVVVDGWRVDCGGCVGEQIFHLEDARNVVVRNSEISDNTDAPLIWISGSNLSFVNNRIHDAGVRRGSGAHTECMYVWRVTNLTLQRNHFYHCSVMDVFITGGDVAEGGLVENNVFEKPWEFTGEISDSAYAFHFRNGGSPSPDPSGWVFRHNTFVGSLSISPGENPVGPGGLTVVGNVFLAGSPCGHANATYAFNAFVSRGCGTNIVSGSVSTFLAGFAHTGDPGNYSLRAGSILRDRGDPARHPARDRAGKLRTGRPDIGAYEFR